MHAEIQQAIDLLHQDRPGALEQSVSVLERAVYAFSMRVCGHPEDAEDTAQEVLMRATPYLPRFENAGALAVWLYKTAKNRCLTSRRKSKFAPAHMLSLEELMPDRSELESLSGDARSTPESALLRQEHGELLLEAVRALPPEYRLVLVLHDMEGLDSAQISQIMDVREGTVRVRLHRARLFVRKQLASSLKRKKPLPKPSAVHRPTRQCRQLFSMLSDYLDGVMDDALCRHLQQHLGQCAPCRAFLSSLRSVVQQCRECGQSASNRRRAATPQGTKQM